MSSSRSPLVLAVLALALLAVPASFAKGRDHRALRIQGACTQQSTSKLKIKREDRRLELEFEVDQNQNGVPWTVTVSRNDTVVASLTATTHAPSGSFEIRRRIHGAPRTDTIKVVATNAAGEMCTADNAAKVKAQPAAAPAAAPVAADNDNDDNGNDNDDDNGGDRHGGGDDRGHSGSDS